MLKSEKVYKCFVQDCIILWSFCSNIIWMIRIQNYKCYYTQKSLKVSKFWTCLKMLFWGIPELGRCFYKGFWCNIWRFFSVFSLSVVNMTSTWEMPRNFKVPHSVPNYCISLHHIWSKIRIRNASCYFQRKKSFNYRIFSKPNNKSLCVVAIAMICSNIVSLWTFQYFRRPIDNPADHLWLMELKKWIAKNSTSLSIITKKLHLRCLLGY